MRVRLATILVIASVFFALKSQGEQLASWTQIKTPGVQLTSQIDAGYPMGCQITALFYALKIGPHDWRNAYEGIAGAGDLQKIQTLAAKFGSSASRSSKGQSAFDPQYGTNPNDLPWMIRSLVPSLGEMKLVDYFQLPNAEIDSKNQVLERFHNDLLSRLRAEQPVLAQLLFSNPDFGHAVLITGVQNSVMADGTLQISIIDPMSGRESHAIIAFDQVQVAGLSLYGLSFLDTDVISKKGVLLSIML